MSAPRQRGRRPGSTDTRSAILAAAVEQFASHGYAGASLRAIADAAGVDQKLIAHYFDSKHGLFTAAMQLPVDPAELLPFLVAGDHDTLGERVATVVVGLLDESATRERMVALIRAAASQPEIAATLREFLEREVLEPGGARLGPDGARRIALTASQFVGLTVARHIVGVEPLTSASNEQLVRALAPTFQRYLTGPLD